MMIWKFALAAGMLALISGCGEPDATPSSAAALGGADMSAGALVQDRFITAKSPNPHEATLAALLTALDRRDLTVFAVIDHAAAAQSVGQKLPPRTVVIFGNPASGTALMQSAPLVAAELPLRALIYDEGNSTYVAITGLAYLERIYNLQSRSEVIDNIDETVRAVLAESTR